VENENERLNLSDVVSSVGAALGLIAAWLYVAGWEYAYTYFGRFRVPLLMVDIPFQYILIYGGLVVFKNLFLSALITALVICGLWSLLRWLHRLGRFAAKTAIVLAIMCGFALAHTAGIHTANDDFQEERRSDYQAYPRMRLMLKKEMAESPSAVLGDVGTTDCMRLLAATKDRFFLIRPSLVAPGADINTYIISSDQVLATQITGNFASCR
jgi:hypothetical protein